MGKMTVYEYLKSEASEGRMEVPCELSVISDATDKNINEVYRALSKLQELDVIEIVTYRGKTTIKWLGER